MTTASKITIIRVFLIPVMMGALYLSKGNTGIWMYAALALFLIGSLTDYIDGMVARKYHQVSDFGAFLDPLADKLLTISIMTVFCEWGMFPSWALVLVLTREFAVTGLRLIAAGKGKVISAGWSGKVKTASTMVCLIAWMAFPASRFLAALVPAVIVLTTLYSGVEYFVRNWKYLW